MVTEAARDPLMEPCPDCGTLPGGWHDVEQHHESAMGTRASVEGYKTPRDVNDLDAYGTCWICGDKTDHDGTAHGHATGDNLSRYDILAYLKQVGV